MQKNNRLLWITRTAVFIALLIVIQLATAPLGNQIITGSLVNMLLIVSVMTGGLWSGACVALISPVFAKLLNIGPLWGIIPFIALGNLSLALVWHFIGNRVFGKNGKKEVAYVISLVIGAIVKFIVLYIGVVKLAVPIILQLPDPQAQAVSGIFSVPQLITAAIGGGLAFIILPLLSNFLKNPAKDN